MVSTAVTTSADLKFPLPFVAATFCSYSKLSLLILKTKINSTNWLIGILLQLLS